MPQIGAYEAKTQLPRLLKRVEQGERFVITRHGRPVAELIPLGQVSQDAVQRAIEDLKAFQQSHSLGGLSVRELREEGRRY